jgi:hypothetical protein
VALQGHQDDHRRGRQQHHRAGSAHVLDGGGLGAGHGAGAARG